MPVRPARCDDAHAIADVHVAAWRSTYRGIVPDDYLADLQVASRERMWKNLLCNQSATCVHVVDDPDAGIVGFVSGGQERNGDPQYAGEIYTIYILEQYQRRGYGRKLLEALVRDLLAQKITSMLVWVIAVNPACKFYESLGGIQLRRQMIDIGGTLVEEVAYGWNDIHRLLPHR